MTASRPPDRFDVPVERLATGPGHARRATAVALTIVLVLAGAFGLARLTERRPIASRPDEGSPRPGVSGPATSEAAPSAQATRPPLAVLRSQGARIERLPEVAMAPLPGAPEVTVVERTGDGLHDLRILVWTPDDARTRTIRTIRAAAPEPPDDLVAPVIAPDRRHLVVLATERTAEPGLAAARVIDDTGNVLWTGSDVSIQSGAVWSADSRLVVLAGQPRRWHLVRLDRPDHATAAEVTLPMSVFLPTPIPTSSVTVPSVDPRTVPLGFSADGRWAYGGVVSPNLGMLIGAFRVATDGSTVERLPDFRVDAPDGLVPRPGTAGVRTVDPASGRVATERINADVSGGPRVVEVRGPDAAFLFTIDAPVTLATEWVGDGTMVALVADSLLFPESIELRPIDRDGTAGEPLLATGPLSGGALIGVRDGVAVVGLVASRPELSAELVALDLSDPDRQTALPLSLGGDRLIVAASLDR